MNYQSDLWSIGVITYELLYGFKPFKTMNDQTQAIYSFPPSQNVSNEAKDFIQGLLQVRRKKRFNWEQLFAHPFMK